MKITFWSPVHGQTAVTSNLLAIAIYSTLQYKIKSLITQTNFSMNNLETPLVGNLAKETDYFQDNGIDALARSIKSTPLDQEAFYTASVSLLNKQLSLLSGTTKCNQEFYENDMGKVINNIISYAELYYNIIYIDTNSGNSGLTPQVLEKSDLIIINLCQNKSVLDSFFHDYKFDPKKVIYLIGNYDKRSMNNKRNLRKQYKLMNSQNSAVIPYCTEFADAGSSGNLIDFIQKNMEAGRDDKNRYFMDSIALASEKILKKTGWKGGML